MSTALKLKFQPKFHVTFFQPFGEKNVFQPYREFFYEIPAIENVETIVIKY